MGDGGGDGSLTGAAWSGRQLGFRPALSAHSFPAAVASRRVVSIPIPIDGNLTTAVTITDTITISTFSYFLY